MKSLMAALLLGALGLGAVGADSAAATQSALKLHECRLEHPLRLASIAARCGTLKVPLDRAHADGPSLDLRVAVVPALNRRAAAPPIFLFAGGPGQGAADLYTGLAGAFARVNRNHAIVLVDQRGTGNSSPLTCAYPDDWQAPLDKPALRQATLDCLKKYGDGVRFYTSSAAVQDAAAVREALGYASIDLYGVSYGTRVAQLFMRRFPTAVHAVILDGVTYPEQAIGPDTPNDAERALQMILSRCQNSRDCAAAYPELRQELQGLRQRFGPQRTALTAPDPSSGELLKIEFDRAMFNATLRFLSYSASQASLLPSLIHQAAQGSLAPLAVQAIMAARQVGDQLASGMQNSVVCSEDEPYFAAASTATDRTGDAETYLGNDQLDALREICKLWPRGPVDADLHRPLRSDIPTLLLSGEIDPVTPPLDAERAARGLSNHRHLVLNGEGHGQAATACVPKLMAQFLDTGSPSTLDASCLTGHVPAPFFVNMTGPAP